MSEGMKYKGHSLFTRPKKSKKTHGSEIVAQQVRPERPDFPSNARHVDWPTMMGMSGKRNHERHLFQGEASTK